MIFRAKNLRIRAVLTLLALPLASGVAAQSYEPQDGNITVNGTPDPSQMIMGPDIKGTIIGRKGNRIKVLSADGTNRTIAFDATTTIKAVGGLFGANQRRLAEDSLLNGLPVTIKTLQSGDYFYATQISFRTNDLKTAAMIRNGTAQRFEEQEAATAALRGRMGDIDKYNIKSTTNVYFESGKANLSSQARFELCAAATAAEAIDNALILVVGYTDSTGSADLNQRLSERRAASVINYLQQACRWKPYRVLTPTGMAEADPLADNMTEEGKAQNRRVAVNVLVSKAIDGL